MNRFERQNACFNLEGYFLPRPNETYKDAFERSRQEFLKEMENTLQNVRDLTFGEFLEVTVRKDPQEV